MTEREDRLLRIIEELVRKIPDAAPRCDAAVSTPDGATFYCHLPWGHDGGHRASGDTASPVAEPPMCCAPVGSPEFYCHRPLGHVGACGPWCGQRVRTGFRTSGPCLRPWGHPGEHDPYADPYSER